MSNFVLRKRHGATLVIQLNRPERRNAFDLEVRHELSLAITEARDDDGVRAVVVTGSNGVFCAGGDLKDISGGKRTTYQTRDRIRRMHLWFRELVNLEKPVIAAVDGAAFGAGFNLALACDFIIGTPTTRFCSVFGRIGLVPDLGGFFLLPRMIGLQRAKEIIFTAREVKAPEALSLGLLYRVVPSETLLDEALALAARFHGASVEAIGMSKNILNRSFNLDQDTLAELESHAQAMSLHSEYHHDAVNRFLDKQPLAFVWDETPP